MHQLGAFKIKVNGKILDYRQGAELNLDESLVKNPDYLQADKFRNWVVSL